MGEARIRRAFHGSLDVRKFRRPRTSVLKPLALFLASTYSRAGYAYTLRVRVQPGRALGGEPFLEQPQVEILEGDGGDIDVFFEVNLQQQQLGCFVRTWSHNHLHGRNFVLQTLTVIPAATLQAEGNTLLQCIFTEPSVTIVPALGGTSAGG